MEAHLKILKIKKPGNWSKTQIVYKTFGKASISKKHCNFFVNEGGASAEEIENLINFVRKKSLTNTK